MNAGAYAVADRCMNASPSMITAPVTLECPRGSYYVLTFRAPLGKRSKIKVEDDDEAADRKPKLRDGTTRVKRKKGQGDTLEAYEVSAASPARWEPAAKVEDSKTGILTVRIHDTSGLHETTTHMDILQKTESTATMSQSAVPNVVVRDGKALPMIEVVLPRWSDVLRSKSLQARSRSHTEQQMPAETGGSSREATQVNEKPRATVEPFGGSFRRNAEPERHNPGPAEVAQAIRELRNVSSKPDYGVIRVLTVDGFKPDVKVKKELMLSDEYVLDALTWEGINHRFPIPVPPDVAECPFPRAYISNLYGGNLQATFPRLNPDFAFLTLEWNPHAPTRPGVSGLFFEGTRHAVDDMKDVLRTFVRVRSGKWVYMGQYMFRPGKSLTAESWKQQSEVVRRTWAQGYIRYSGTAVCVRVWLRKQRGSDYKVTDEDYEAAEPNMKEIQASITEEDINGAFDRGEEEMGVYTMTCVGYDAEFIRLLGRNLHLWNPPALTKKKQGAAPGRVQRPKTGKGTGSAKRKPAEVQSDGEHSDGRAEEPGALEGNGDRYEDVKMIPAGSVQLPERRSTRERLCCSNIVRSVECKPDGLVHPVRSGGVLSQANRKARGGARTVMKPFRHLVGHIKHSDPERESGTLDCNLIDIQDYW
ncbi:hypothetical protein K466DRAFT_657153 [Polyporus arcularius HHB13444]|uniref:DUF6697 domain-containing protein n=1 Tax=Polyporus arcularius HHB13444 TaxID=1314778 RepID=A0A5C3NXV4_9APHY|nr:hypothetical protein K466DRAFT_657153 [Polyporus arcularius HHB13444]